MKAKLHVMLFAAFLLITNFIKAQIAATSVDSSFNITNPSNAVSKSDSDYALINTTLGINDSASLKFGFSQYGFQSMSFQVTLQQDNGLISVNLLKSINLYIYDNNNHLIASKQGFTTADANVLEGTNNIYTLSIPDVKTAGKIAFGRITLKGQSGVNTKIRIYYAKLRFQCPNYAADSIVKATNVINANNAVSYTRSDYAILAPTLTGSSNITLRFPNAANKDISVVFVFGKGASTVNANLLSSLNLAVYDNTGKKLVADSTLSMADIQLLDSDKFSIALKAPAGSGSKITSASVKYSNLAGALTNLKFYFITVSSNTQSFIRPSVTPSAGTLCPGQYLRLTAKTSQIETITWQWYKDNTLVKNATGNTHTINQPGSYFVVDTKDGCSNLTPPVIITQGMCKEATPDQSYVLKTYPNPFNSYTILSLNGLHAKAMISVTDKSGNTIQAVNTAGSQQIRLLQTAVPGLYFIKVVTESGDIYSAKVIKQ